MFACNRIVEKACTNDDSMVPGLVLAEAADLCQKDQSNIQKIIKGLSGKLSNTFVQVRVKALTVMLHLARNGPPGVVLELRQYTSYISDTIQFRGEPHPVLGMQPYEQMKDLAQQILDQTYQSQNRVAAGGYGAPPGPMFGQQVQNVYQQQPPPPAQPQPAYSITTPYPQQTAPAQSSITTPYPTQSTGYGSPYQSTGNNFNFQQSLGSVSNVPKAQPKKPGESVYDDVKNWFKKTINTKKGGYSNYEAQQISQQQQQQQMTGGMYVSYPQQDNYSYQMTPQAPSANPYDDKNKTTTSATLIDGQGPSRQSNVSHHELNSLKMKKKATNLSPAKKLLKITGGRALATAQELTAFKNSMTIESINELAEGLVVDKEWKSAVRAILGLEVAAEVYGLPAVAKTKNEVLSLTGAPQASLRSAATRFYAAIKDVEPAEPTMETTTAFNFGDAADTVIVTPGEVNTDELEFSFAQAETRPNIMQKLEQPAAAATTTTTTTAASTNTTTAKPQGTEVAQPAAEEAQTANENEEQPEVEQPEADEQENDEEHEEEAAQEDADEE